MASIADIIRAGIVEGLTTQEILDRVKQEKPEANTSAACVAYYRSKAKKAGGEVPRPAKKPIVEPTSATDEAPVYSVKNVKTFMGLEGQGFNASLYRNGKLVAFVIDDASGGPLMIEWKDRTDKAEWPRLDYKGEEFTYRGTREEQILFNYCETLPPHVCSFTTSEGLPITMKMDAELFVDELVNDQIALNALKKTMRTKLVYINKVGELMEIKCADTPKNRAQVLEKWAVRILNGLSDEELRAELKKL